MNILKSLLQAFSKKKSKEETSEKINNKNIVDSSNNSEELTFDVQLKDVKVQKIKIKR